MATLQIKNKYEVSFIKLIKESKEDGGIPDRIQINGREAWEILNEIRAVGSGAFVIEPTDEYDPQFLLKSSKERIDQDVAEDLVTRWWRKQFSVIFKNKADKIPVEVVPEKRPGATKPKKDKPLPPPPTTPKLEAVDNKEEKEDNDTPDQPNE